MEKRLLMATFLKELTLHAKFNAIFVHFGLEIFHVV